MQQSIEGAARALVVVGRCETEYLRMGQGPAALLLAERGDPLALELAGRLAERHRVYLPELPETPGRRPDFATWLRGFIDCIGVAHVPVIVLADRFSTAALAYAMVDSLRVARLALLIEDPCGIGQRGPTLVETIGEAGAPLLLRWVVREPAETPVALAREVADFLAAEVLTA